MAKRALETTEPDAKKPRVLERHVTVVFLLCKDQEEAKKWMEEKLGFETHTDSSFPGDNGATMRWLSLRHPSQTVVEIALELAPKDQEELIGSQVGDAVLFVLGSTDINADYERLKAAGVKFTSEVIEEPWGKDAHFEDLYGNKWLLHSDETSTPGLNYQTLLVNDQEESKKYFENLDWVVVDDKTFKMGEEEGRWLTMKPSSVSEMALSLEMARSDVQKSRVGKQSYVIGTKDIHAVVSLYREKGAKIEKDATKMPWGWWTDFKDALGNFVGLVSELEKTEESDSAATASESIAASTDAVPSAPEEPAKAVESATPAPEQVASVGAQ